MTRRTLALMGGLFAAFSRKRLTETDERNTLTKNRHGDCGTPLARRAVLVIGLRAVAGGRVGLRSRGLRRGRGFGFGTGRDEQERQ